MKTRILAVVALSLTIGAIVGVALGPLPGTGIFALSQLAGAAHLVRRRARAAAQLERSMIPIRIHRVVRDEHAVRDPR